MASCMLTIAIRDSTKTHNYRLDASQYIWCFNFVVMTMSRMLLQLCIGCAYQNGSTWKWLWWHFMCCMVSLHHTWISWFVSLSCLSPSSLVVSTPTARSTIPSIDCRPSFISHHHIIPLEFLATACSVFSFSTCLPSTSKDSPFSELFPEILLWQFRFLTILHFRALWDSFAIATLTNSDWHWQGHQPHMKFTDTKRTKPSTAKEEFYRL